MPTNRSALGARKGCVIRRGSSHELFLLALETPRETVVNLFDL